MQIAHLKLDSRGFTTQQVEVVKTTARRVRIRARSRTRLYWRKVDVPAGTELLIAKHRLVDAHRFGEPVQEINRLTGRPC